MTKAIYALILPLVVVSGLVFANREINNEASRKSSAKSLTDAERRAEMKKCEATPAGIKCKKWEAPPKCNKVPAGAAKIRSQKSTSTMEAVVTALSLPSGSGADFGMMVKINGYDYILSFGRENANEFQQLHSLKVNDKIMIRSHSVFSVMYSPRFSYPIIAGDYVEHDNKIIFKRAPRNGGC